MWDVRVEWLRDGKKGSKQTEWMLENEILCFFSFFQIDVVSDQQARQLESTSCGEINFMQSQTFDRFIEYLRHSTQL